MNLALVEHHFGNWTMRSLMIDAEPWFVARDVSTALGYTNGRDAVATHVHDDDKGVAPLDTLGGPQNMAIVNESGLFALVFGSRLEAAKAFKRWVTSEVLPQLRRTGTYSTSLPADPVFPVPATFVEALELALGQARIIEQQAAELNHVRPRAAMAEALIDAAGDYSLREAAQILSRDPAISTGQNRLLGTLVELGWVDRKAKLPYQATINAGRLDVRARTWEHPVEGPKVSYSVRVTPKGLADLHSHLGGTSALTALASA